MLELLRRRLLAQHRDVGRQRAEPCGDHALRGQIRFGQRRAIVLERDTERGAVDAHDFPGRAVGDIHDGR